MACWFWRPFMYTDAPVDGVLADCTDISYTVFPAKE